jgi:DNA-binding transcriptional regulator YiaG
MIRAYSKVYLEKARTNLGRMLDFATYDLGYDPSEFFDHFINCGLAERFAKGDFTLIAGMSGVELAYRVLELTHNQVEHPKPRYTADRSPEYWAGWVLAYYQWETAMPFEGILDYIPLYDIIRMYSPYHEMDVRHFCARMNELYREANPDTKLKQLRQRAGISQNNLAELSGVPKRTIQQYEQRQKSINKAQAEYLIMLARALRCNAEDLIEPVE